jgi:predicted  nucleic acid-binding Zn-ribbon protein
MAFTEKELAAQTAQIEKLKEELTSLNSRFDQLLKAAGMTEADLETLDLENQPPEVKAMLAEAQEAAKRAGELQAAEARRESPLPQAAPSHRAGIIKL